MRKSQTQIKAESLKESDADSFPVDADADAEISTSPEACRAIAVIRVT